MDRILFINKSIFINIYKLIIFSQLNYNDETINLELSIRHNIKLVVNNWRISTSNKIALGLS